MILFDFSSIGQSESPSLGTSFFVNIAAYVEFFINS